MIEADDIAATMEQVVRLGGRAHPKVQPERMAMATPDGTDTRFELEEFEDPEGNLVGIIQR